jgi:hypothetical protein
MWIEVDTDPDPAFKVNTDPDPGFLMTFILPPKKALVGSKTWDGQKCGSRINIPDLQ